jgi:parvulin-like peptidyl-prolyl isomerase
MTRTTTKLAVAACAVAVAVLAGCGKEKGAVVVPNVMDDSQIVIWVGDTGIPQGALRAEIGRLEKGIPPHLQEDALKAVRLQVLDRAIENIVMRTLVKTAYDRSGMVISQEEIDQAKAAIFGNMKNDEALAIMLAENNMTIPQLEDNLRLDIFRNRTLKDKIDAALEAVTEETAKAYYDEHLDREFTMPEGRMVSHILIRVAPDATEEAKAEAKKKAEDVRKALLEGSDFASLARAVSECPSAQRGGDLGLIPTERKSDGPFDTAAFSQPVGEIGEVVESPSGYHVIKVTEEVPRTVFPFEDVKDRLLTSLKMKAQRAVGLEYVAQLKEEIGVRFDGALSDLNKPAPAAGAALESEAEAEGDGAAEGESGAED